MSWKDFLAAHMNVLAGADFFTVEVLKWRGLVTNYVLFFIHLKTRRITIAGITRHPDGEWMEQIARSATQETWGYLNECRYVLHDRDEKFCASFRSALTAAGVKPLAGLRWYLHLGSTVSLRRIAHREAARFSADIDTRLSDWGYLGSSLRCHRAVCSGLPQAS